MHHLGVKIFEQSGAELHAAKSIAVFHRWIQKRDLPDLLIDVADYAHIPGGPGVILVGQEAAYSLDNTGTRLGLLYQRKSRDDRDDRETLQSAYDAAVAACRQIEAEPEFKGHLKFDDREFAIVFNDRALYPNTDESWARVQSAVRGFLDGLLGVGEYKLIRTAEDRRERLSVEVRRI